MASGTITNTSLRGRTYQINWSSVINVAGNYSEITCEHYLINQKEYSLNISARSNTCTVDGASVGYTSSAIKTDGNSTIHLGTTRHTVWHNADGSKQTTITGVFNIKATLKDGYVSSVTAEAVVVLDTIPRAATPTLSVPSVLMQDGSVWINTNGMPETFDYVLTYTFGGETGTISDNAGGGATWIPHIGLAGQIPNSDRGYGQITCHTWSKDRQTHIGSNSVPIELIVPNWLTPSVSATYRDTSSAFDLFGTLVQNASKLEVSADITQAYGSAIRSTSLTLDGAVYAGAVILGKGELTLVLTATDNRGRTGEWRKTISVAEYNPPNVILSAHRCNADGTANDLGEYAQITVSGGITPLAGNTLYLSVQQGYEKKEAAALPASWIVDAPSTDPMNISATLSDKLYSTTRSMVLSTGYATMDLLKGGKGVSFGKSATREGLDCDMHLYMCGKTISELPTPTAYDQAAPKGYVDGGCYVAAGHVMSSTGNDVAGYGSVTVIITGSLAAIHFALKVETAPGSGEDIDYGINRDLLQNLNPNIPHITPIAGGVCRFVRDGADDGALTGFGGTMAVHNQFWVPARVYTHEGSIGSWESSQLSGCSLTGVCFGIVGS